MYLLFFTSSRARQQSGFSLIELLIAVAVFVLAAGLILPGFNFFQRQSALDAATQEIISTLRLAQNQSLASENANSFGVWFEADKFILFKGPTFYPEATDNVSHPLSPSLRLSEISLNGNNFVVFDKLNGSAANYGSLKIEQADDSAKNKTIFIDAAGIISLATSLPVDSDRQTDSRHTEFTYSQNTQDAASLTLYFPLASQSENIAYQDYLNSAKTEFSWEGTITVQGNEQTIKIHTHNLSAANTQFCVHRDRRYNSQALVLLLDNQNLISYSATGTTTRGTSIWAGEPQNQ